MGYENVYTGGKSDTLKKMEYFSLRKYRSKSFLPSVWKKEGENWFRLIYRPSVSGMKVGWLEATMQLLGLYHEVNKDMVDAAIEEVLSMDFWNMRFDDLISELVPYRYLWELPQNVYTLPMDELYTAEAVLVEKGVVLYGLVGERGENEWWSMVEVPLKNIVYFCRGWSSMVIPDFDSFLKKPDEDFVLMNMYHNEYLFLKNFKGIGDLKDVFRFEGYEECIGKGKLSKVSEGLKVRFGFINGSFADLKDNYTKLKENLECGALTRKKDLFLSMFI